MPLALEPERPVLALCAVMALPPLLDGVAAELENEIGPVGSRGPVYRFDYTSYYEEEMGGELCKQVLAFADLVPPHRLAELKGRTMEIERRLALEDGGGGLRRRANIDPGLLSEGSLVLATAKYGCTPRSPCCSSAAATARSPGPTPTTGAGRCRLSCWGCGATCWRDGGKGGESLEGRRGNQLAAGGRRSASGTNGLGSSPVYMCPGRIRRLSPCCSMTWAAQPAMRLATKIGVYRGIGIPIM